MPHSRFASLDPGTYALPPEVVEQTLTPALVVDLRRVRANLRRVLALTGGPERWRPHVKTTKIPAVWVEVARAGVRHFKCATTREARHLLATLRNEGVQGDLLVAYPHRGPALAELGRLATEHPETKLSVLCEDPELVTEIPAAVSLFIDVNPGMHRTGIPLTERATILDVARRAGARFRGLHYYDGHLHTDDLAARRAAIFAGYDELLDLCREVDPGEIREIITSGTPAFLHSLAYPGFEGLLHRVSPGTVVFHDLRTEQENPDLELEPAALVLTRVVSHPRADLATCDAGSKSIAAEAGDPCAFVLGHPGLTPQPPSEEHLPLLVEHGQRPARGETLLLIPRHVCPTVNLAEEAWLVDDDGYTVATVAARAHDLTSS